MEPREEASGRSMALPSMGNRKQKPLHLSPRVGQIWIGGQPVDADARRLDEGAGPVRRSQRLLEHSES